MDKYVIKGVKKLFGLVKTKIRLAREVDTVYVKPKPVPLVKFFSEVELNSIDECEQFFLKLKKEFNAEDEESCAQTILMCFDIIESVKHEYEPQLTVTEDDFQGLEVESRNTNKPLTISLMGDCPRDGPCLFVGENPPKSCVWLGSVPSNIMFFLNYALKSNYFSQDGELANIKVQLGRKTLLNYVVVFSLKHLSCL